LHCLVPLKLFAFAFQTKFVCYKKYIQKQDKKTLDTAFLIEMGVIFYFEFEKALPNDYL